MAKTYSQVLQDPAPSSTPAVLRPAGQTVPTKGPPPPCIPLSRPRIQPTPEQPTVQPTVQPAVQPAVAPAPSPLGAPAANLNHEARVVLVAGGSSQKRKLPDEEGGKKPGRRPKKKARKSKKKKMQSSGSLGDDDDSSSDGYKWACHYVRHSLDRNSRCAVREFSRFSDLIQHLRREHGPPEEPYCPRCLESFDEASERDLHAADCRTVVPQEFLTTDELGAIKALRLSKSELQEAIQGPLSDTKHTICFLKWFYIWEKFFDGGPGVSPYLGPLVDEVALALRSRNGPNLAATLQNSAGLPEPAHLDAMERAAYDPSPPAPRYRTPRVVQTPDLASDLQSDVEPDVQSDTQSDMQPGMQFAVRPAVHPGAQLDVQPDVQSEFQLSPGIPQPHEAVFNSDDCWLLASMNMVPPTHFPFYFTQPTPPTMPPPPDPDDHHLIGPVVSAHAMEQGPTAGLYLNPSSTWAQFPG